MKKIVCVQSMILAFLISLAFPFVSFADEKKSIQLQLLGSNIGSGAHLGYHLNDMFFVGADMSAISISSDEKDSSGTVTAELKFSTQVFMLRISPFSGAFYIQGGMVSRKWDLEATGVSQIGDSGESGTVTAEVKFPRSAANVGLGWNWISDFGLSGGLGLGTIMGGDPKVEMTVTDTTGTVTDSDIQEEEDQLKSDMKQFANVPYVHLQIGWNF